VDLQGLDDAHGKQNCSFVASVGFGPRSNDQSDFQDSADACPHRESSSLQIDVFPLKPENLAPAEAKGKGHCDDGLKAITFDGIQQPVHIVDSRSGNLPSRGTGNVHQLGDISHHVTVLECDVQGGAQAGEGELTFTNSLFRIATRRDAETYVFTADEFLRIRRPSSGACPQPEWDE